MCLMVSFGLLMDMPYFGCSCGVLAITLVSLIQIESFKFLGNLEFEGNNLHQGRVSNL